MFYEFNCSVPTISSDYLRKRQASFIKLFTHLNPKGERSSLPETFFKKEQKPDEGTRLPRLSPSPTHAVAVSPLRRAFQEKVRGRQLSEEPETVKLKLASLGGLSDQFLKGERAAASSLS